MVERKTHFVVLCKLGGCTAQAALEGFTRLMKKLHSFLRESLTSDRGSEVACHIEQADRLNVNIKFADPHARWQRGSNEKTDDLLRQFLHKGINLSQMSQSHLKNFARLLSRRPRQTPGRLSPKDITAKKVTELAKLVAIDPLDRRLGGSTR